VITFSHSVAFN